MNPPTVVSLSMVAVWFIGPPLLAQQLVYTLDDPTITSTDRFGNSVATDGNYLLVGAYLDSTRGRNVGQAHLFDAPSGALLRTFDDPTPTGQDLFGSEVAIAGDYAVIGAPGDDTGRVNAGQVHVFNIATGDLVHTLQVSSPNNASPSFGISVATAGDNILIGTFNSDEAYLFDATTGSRLATYHDPSPHGGDHFGTGVALDGDHVLVGAPFRDTAYLFDATTGALLQTFDDPIPTAADLFGWNLALDGEQIVIGAHQASTDVQIAGRAYVFDATSGQLQHILEEPQPLRLARFGLSVAIEQNRVLVGAPFSENGQTHQFDAATGAFVSTYNDPTPTVGDAFGASVAINGDRVVIGAISDDTFGINVGQVHVFVIPEPSTSALFVWALVLVATRQRRSQAVCVDG